MEIAIKGTWLKTKSARWVNLAHCDLIELQHNEQAKVWRVIAWNALQPQVEAYILAEFGKESAALDWQNKLLDTIMQQAK